MQTIVKPRFDFPTSKEIEDALLKKIYNTTDPEPHISDFYDPLADYFDLDKDIRNRKATTTPEAQWNNSVRWAKEALKNKGFVEQIRHGHWKITEEGRNYVEKNLL